MAGDPVFGGTRHRLGGPAGHLRAPLQGAGHRVRVANLSEWNLHASLVELAGLRSLPVSRGTVSAKESTIDLFEELCADESI